MVFLEALVMLIALALLLLNYYFIF